MPRNSAILFAVFALLLMVIPAQSQPNGPLVTVMTYNVQIGASAHDNPSFDPSYFNLPKIVAIMNTQRPDIILMQEIDRFSPRSGGEDEPKRLADLLGMNYAFAAAIGDENDPANPPQYGVAIFSRFPITSSQKYRLPGEPGKKRESRVALQAQLDVQGTNLQVICTHFGLTPAERSAQGKYLAGVISKLKTPVVVGGDFNTEANSPELSPIAKLLTNPFDALRLESYWRLSYPSGIDSRKAIDHLFISKDMMINNIKVVRDLSHASDHNPVVGFFWLPAPAK